MEVRMLNSKLVKSKSFHIVMIGALVAQTSVQAFSITEYAAVGKQMAQTSLEYAKTTATQIANSEFVGSATQYVKSTGNNVVEFIAENPLSTAFYLGAGLAVIGLILDAHDDYKSDQRYEAKRAQEETEDGGPHA